MGENIAETINVGDFLVSYVGTCLMRKAMWYRPSGIYTNFAPSDIGYETFMHFLAAQTDGHAFPFKDVPAGSIYFGRSKNCTMRA